MHASGTNLDFTFPIPANQTVITEAILDFITSGSPFPTNAIAGEKNISGLYNLGASLCTSRSVPPSNRVHIASHGVLFGRNYFDFAPNGYRYVDVATATGDAVLFYDRLGIGKSDHPEDSVNVVQAGIQVGILHSLTNMLRSGAIGACSFDKVIGVGHSFGSVLTSSITAQHPSDFDAVVLTGFSLNLTGGPLFWAANTLVAAHANRPSRFRDLNNGYLVGESNVTAATTCFRAPEYSEFILQEHERTKQTVTLGEIFSVVSVVMPSPHYDKPVLGVNGENDLPFCLGNCTYPTDLTRTALEFYAELKKDKSKFKTLTVEGTGHGVNLHHTAQKTFEWIQKTLKDLDV